MVAGWVVVFSFLLYLCLLFAIAYFGDRFGLQNAPPFVRSTVYALSLAIYCTSWTYYGSVGFAALSGLDFLAVYIGPFLLFAVGGPIVKGIVRIAKEQRSTSTADFIATRYNKSPVVAAVVSIVSVVGIIPYIALQLKAVSMSIGVFLTDDKIPSEGVPLLGDVAFIVALVLIAFAIIFGTRHSDATEHQSGMTLVIVMAAIVKLTCFIAVGIFVIFFMYNGLDGIDNALIRLGIQRSWSADTSPVQDYAVLILLGCCAGLLLPRQFHMTVVENTHQDDIKRALWLFPLYLILINLFTVPLAWAGRAFSPNWTIDPDMVILALPMSEGASTIALMTFIGGFSAATAMVVVESVALAVMVSNHLVLPYVLGRWPEIANTNADLGGFVLVVRRTAITTIILMAYLYYYLAGQAHLAAMGLLSFAAIVQLAPAFWGGLFWSRGTAMGANTGMIVGIIVWAYTLLIPSVMGNHGDSPFVAQGPFGWEFLKPTALFGIQADELTHGVVWSLGLNILCYVGLSLLWPASDEEMMHADAFIGQDDTQVKQTFRLFGVSATVDELRTTVTRYLGKSRTTESFDAYYRSRGAVYDGKVEADVQLVKFAESLLSSVVGGSSARLALSLLLRRRAVSNKTALQLLDDASAAIQTSRDLLQHAMDHARQGLMVLDKNMNLVAWNRSFTDIYELPSDVVSVGTPFEDLCRFNAKRGLYGPGSVDELVAGRLKSYTPQYRLLRHRLYPSGRVVEVSSSRLPNGGVVATHTDVTDVVAVEEERMRAHEILERRVRERTEELTRVNQALRRAKAEADEANISKTRFLAAASHDILQPLNAARLYTTSLVDRDRRQGDAILAENIDLSLDAVEDILTTLLDISRLDTGAMKPELSSFRIEELTRPLQREFEPLANEKNLKLKFVHNSKTIRSDRRLLRRLLQNLISNAIKYTTTGTVLVGSRRKSGKLSLEVWDTGIGIPAAKRKVIFEEFQRLEQGAKVAKGLGLGLSIVERTARLLDHALTVDSQHGEGSVFRVCIPIVADLPVMSSVPAETNAKPIGALSGLKVLVIDNEPHIVEGMRLLLTGWGCLLRTASGLKEAEAVLVEEKTVPPDVIVADYHLDEGDGLQVIKQLRWKIGHDLPAALLTADRSPTMREQAEALEVPVFNKPVKPAALRAWLSRLRVSDTVADG